MINFLYEMFIKSLSDIVKVLYCLVLERKVGVHQNINFGSGFYLSEEAIPR